MEYRDIDLNCIHIDTSSPWRDLTTEGLKEIFRSSNVKRDVPRSQQIILWVKGVKSSSEIRVVWHKGSRDLPFSYARLLDQDYEGNGRMRAYKLHRNVTCSKVEGNALQKQRKSWHGKKSLSLPDEKSLTERLRGSAIPHMRRLLNKHERKKRIFADKFKF